MMDPLRRHAILAIILTILVVGGCAISEEPYKAYEGPVQAVEKVAVLACKGCFVYSIDGKVLSSDLGPRYVDAHLSPGKHAITVYTYYEDTGEIVLSGRFEFAAGRTYLVEQYACFECDPFEVELRMKDSVGGALLASVKGVGEGPYGSAAEKREERERAEEEHEECVRGCWSEFDRCKALGTRGKECQLERVWCVGGCVNSKIGGFPGETPRY